jgi:glycosyltransferase involved in cell wall biosynthesis
MVFDVSVVTRCEDWDRAAPSVRSALAQESVGLELVVVNRLGPERPPESLPELRDPRAVVLSNAGIAGLTADRNRGLRAANGEWVAFLDEGDLWAPEHLSELIDACVAAGADFGCSACWVLGADRQIHGYRATPRPADFGAALLSGADVPSPTVVIAHRTLIQRGGGFDEWLDPLAPWDLWIRWSRCANGWQRHDVPTAAVVAAAAPDRGVLRAELRELGRRYGRDARAVGARFGQAYGSEELAPTAEPQGPVPWLTRLLEPARRTARH